MTRSQRPRTAFEWNESTIVIKIMLVCLGLFVSSFVFSQATIDRTVECSCVNNSAPTGLAQFEEEITVNSGSGESWYISSVSGFYQLSSPVPPAAPVPFTTGPTGDLLAETSPGVYTLAGLHSENVGYSIQVTNIADTLILSNILCAFPSSGIEGDDAICGPEVETYIASNIDASFTYSWDVIENGTIIGASDAESVEIEWDDIPGSGGSLSLTVAGPTGCSSTSFLVVEFEDDINLACNNLVHISINNMCDVNISVDDVLENMQYNDESYELTIMDPATNQLVDLTASISEYLFDTLEFSVEHLCSDNSCWGELIIEDKLVPQLICETDTVRCDANDGPSVTGFPVPSTATVVPLGNNTFRVENFDPCGDAELSYTDEYIEQSCSDDFESLVERTWLFTDFSGSTNSCTQLIAKERTTLADVVFPGHWDGVTNPVLLCDGNFPTLDNGFPDPSFTGFPEEGVCSNISITYVDLPTDVCGATIKIVRKFSAFDHCLDTTITVNQIIKIEDSEAPSFNCPSNMDFFINSTTSCEVDVVTPLPSNVVDCSEVTFEAEIVKINSAGNIAGPISDMNFNGSTFSSPDRELGLHRVTYTATDECGFKSTCDFLVEVFDNSAPTAVCDLNTTIAIDNEGFAIVPVTTFDDGSYDNCAVSKIEISRGPNGCGASSGFGESITLCCEDVNNEVMVTLRVTDEAGNVNTCMVAVMVQDKKAPILNCPANVTVSCNDDISDLSSFGTATVSDNCSATLTETSNSNINGCSVGTITRTFSAVDIGGNEVSCTQVITVQDPDPLTLNQIIWPGTYTTNDCVSPNLDPDDLPFNNAYPQVANNQCSDIVMDYTDKVFIGINSFACKTIIRTWTVKDLCGDPDGFSFEQSLQVIDNQKPVFDACSNQLIEGEFADECSYTVELSKSATDQCTPQELLSYTYSIDFYIDGSMDIQGNSNSLSEDFPVGQHRITWTVDDECGNETSCQEVITIEDKKQPTPYCLGGISTVLMPSTGTIAIWANDFDVNSEDDCTEQEDLRFSFSSNPTNTGMTFSCADLGGAEEKIIELQIYVHDEAGNFDFCTSYIKLQDNNNTCDTSSMLVALSGVVSTEDQKQMELVDMELTNMADGEVATFSTDDLGVYAFNDLDAMYNYTIAPSYEDDDYYNGITTLDILLIQRHILGITPLNSPYKVIAADVDGNQSVNGVDIIQIRKLLLGFYDEFPNTENWQFVDGNQEFSNTYSPWPYNSEVNILADKSYGNMNFVMIKTGDINLSRATEFTSNDAETRTQPVVLNYQWKKADDAYTLVLSTDGEMNLSGLQLEVELEEITALQDVKSILDINDEDIFIDGNVLRLSFAGAFAQKVNGTLIEFTFGAPTPIKLPEYGRFQSEMYVGDALEVQEIKLNEIGGIAPNYATKVYQNKPNPFINQTEIIVELAQSETVLLEVHDMNGRIVVNKNISLIEGENSIWLSSEEVSHGNGGVYIYTLSGSFGQISKRMIILQ